LELVNKCPANLQEMAFKTILEHWFTSNTVPASPPKGSGQGTGTGSPPAAGVPDGIKPFLTAKGITSDMLEKVFHPIGPGALWLGSEIEGDGKAAKMVNLAILLAVRQAVEGGSFTCTLKELREMALHYNCYDSANFSNNLKNNKQYFKPRDKGADLDLSG